MSSTQKNTIIVVTLVVAVTLIGAAILFPQPIKSFRSRTLVAESNKLMVKGDWRGAFNKAFSAHRLDQKSYPALGAFFKTAARTNSQYLLRIAAAIVVHPESPVEDKVEALTLVHLAGDDLRFMVLYNHLPEEVRGLEEVKFLKARFMAKAGATDVAQKMIDEYLQSGGDDVRFRLLQITLLMNPQMPEESRERGQSLLVELLGQGGEDAKGGLALLWGYPVGLIKPELYPSDTAGILEAIPGIGARDNLAMAKVDLARLTENPDQARSLIEAFVERYRLSETENLAIWLSGLRRPESVLEVLNEERAMTSLVTYDLRLQALAQVEGAESAKKWLETPHPDSSPLLVHLTRAKLAATQDENSEVRQQFQEAFFQVELDRNRESYLRIFEAAMQIGQLHHASRALVQAAKIEGKRFPPIARIGPVVSKLYSDGDFKAMHQIFAAMAPLQPDNMTVINNLAYSKLVLGQDNELSVDLGRKIMEGNPDVLGIRTTLAFGLMQQGNWDEAHETLSDENLSWEQASPADYAIYALSLEQQGRQGRAEEIRSKFEPEQISSAERAAFAAIRASFEGGGKGSIGSL